MNFVQLYLLTPTEQKQYHWCLVASKKVIVTVGCICTLTIYFLGGEAKSWVCYS